jgi:hypothetical protein
MSGWEFVLRGGRVVDPESGYDAVADVAIGEGRIVQIAAGLPAGPADVDVTGLVATAGFVDLADGALGIGVLLGYAPGVDEDEYLRVGAPAHPRRAAAEPGPGAQQVQPGAGQGAPGPGPRHAPEGAAAGRLRRRRGLRSRYARRPGHLYRQHPPVGGHPACAGQRGIRRPRRLDRGRPGPDGRSAPSRADCRSATTGRIASSGRDSNKTLQVKPFAEKTARMF